MKTLCTDFLNRIYPLEGSAISAFQEKLHFESFNRNSFIISEGQVCDKLWFIYQGLVRGYYVNNKVEITSWFAQEHQFFYTADSFLNLLPSSETIQVIEKTQLMYIERKELYQLYDLFPSINHVFRVLAEQNRLINQEQLKDLRSNNAKQRLISFAQRHRSLFLRVPQKHIASHIGVSEGYISELLGIIKV